MFIHSGAGLHGHEYSSRQPTPKQNPVQKRSPLLKPSLVNPALRSQTLPVNTPHFSLSQYASSSGTSAPSGIVSSTSVLPSSHSTLPRLSARSARQFLECTDRTEHIVRFKDQPEIEPSSLHPPKSPTSPAAAKPEHYLSVSFSPIITTCCATPISLEPQARSQLQLPVSQLSSPQQQILSHLNPLEPRKSNPMTEDEGSSASELSDASQNKDHLESHKKKRQQRKSTTFLIAHPAPRQKPKPRIIQTRPQLLLQLQQISHGKRPRPSVDIFPSSVIAGSGIASRLANRFPRVFRLHRELGPHDVLLVRSENYESGIDDEDPGDDEERIGKRELMAVLSPVPRESRAEIVLADGSIWLASPLPNGAFEFVHTDPATGNLTTARWVRRSLSRASMGSAVTTCSPTGYCPSPTPIADHKFTFSIINPLSRRHPIMATLTSNCLDIFDSYTTVPTLSGRFPPTQANQSFPPGPSEDDDSGISMPERTTQIVDEMTKMIISVTGIWVALRQEWSPYYKYPTSNTEYSHPVVVSHSSSNSTDRVRPRSLGSETQLTRLSSVPLCRPSLSLKERICHRGPRNHSPDAVGIPFGIQRRATSTGAAFMQRRTQQQTMSSISDTSDTERPSARPSRRRILSGEWNIKPQAPRNSKIFEQPLDGGVKLDRDGLSSAERTSLDLAHARVGEETLKRLGISETASIQLAQQQKRKSLPVPSRTVAATPASERTMLSLYGNENVGALLMTSPEQKDNADGYFQDLDEEAEGVSIGPSKASIFVDFEDKKRGKWKTLTGWVRKFGSR